MKQFKIVLLLALVALAVTAPFANADNPASPLAKTGKRLLRNWPDTSARDAFVAALDDTAPGAVAAASVNIATNPTDGDTLTIGADVYEFCLVATNDDVNTDTHIGVVIAASATLTRDNLVAAINGTDPDGLHGTLDMSTGDPALANGTESVYALESGNTVIIYSSDSNTAAKVAGDPSIVLAEGLTAAADIWQQGNVNLNTLGGADPQPYNGSISCQTITAAMITNDSAIWAFPFPVTKFMVQTLTSAGVLQSTTAGLGTDAFTLSNGNVVVNFGGGAAPDIQATDNVCVVAFP